MATEQWVVVAWERGDEDGMATVGAPVADRYAALRRMADLRHTHGAVLRMRVVTVAECEALGVA